MDALKVFIDEVERQLDRKLKVVRSDRGGEFYGKFNESGQCPGLFANSLKVGAYVHNTPCLAHRNRMV